MIKIEDINEAEPYRIFIDRYNHALSKNQGSINAISISSLNKKNMIVTSRFVNLKYIRNDEWIFFSNYNSPKSQDFSQHNQISALIYWEKIDFQVRIQATISKSSNFISDKHFKNRSKEKNALAISSKQSNGIDSYEDIVNQYNTTLSDNELISNRPKYWGGFSFYPYYFEFWEGHESRLNKRQVYEKSNDSWKHVILQP